MRRVRWSWLAGLLLLGGCARPVAPPSPLVSPPLPAAAADPSRVPEPGPSGAANLPGNTSPAPGPEPGPSPAPRPDVTPAPASEAEAASAVYLVERVVDGDTIVVVQGKGKSRVRERVRLLGIDTPETVDPRRPVQYFGKEASDHTRRLIEGRTVRLEHPPGSDTRDRYGRIVAFVYRQPDNLLVNLEIVQQGYGFALLKYPFEGMEIFRDAEREAREARRGLWAKNPTGDRDLSASGRPQKPGRRAPAPTGLRR